MSISLKCINCRIKGFQKKCDLLSYLFSFLLTDKQIHRGALLLEIRKINKGVIFHFLSSNREF